MFVFGNLYLIYLITFIAWEIWDPHAGRAAVIITNFVQLKAFNNAITLFETLEAGAKVLANISYIVLFETAVSAHFCIKIKYLH